MRVIRPLISFMIGILYLTSPVFAKNVKKKAKAQNTPVLATVQSAMTALSGKTNVNDVTLTGAVEWIAGSDIRSGTVSYKGASVAYRLDMTFPNGTRSEVVAPFNGLPSGNWIDLSGIAHPMPIHNLMVDPGWFPTIGLEGLIASPTSIFTYVGQETRNGASVLHISVYQQSPNISFDVAAQMQHFTEIEIYLDPSTFLPVSCVYNSHPDNNALVDIPIEIRYSNYQNVSGLQIPFHVQKFINNTLAIDAQFQSASPNTGLTVAQISAQ